MCIGKSKDKAEVLFNLCMGKQLARVEEEHDHEHADKKEERELKKGHKNDTITWKNPRLI